MSDSKTPNSNENYNKQKDEVYDKAIRALENSRWVYLHGGVGAGKTRLASHISLEYVKKFLEEYNKRLHAGIDINNLRGAYAEIPRKRAVFRSVADMLSEMRGAFDPNSDCSQQDYIKDFCRADLLVLDDIGAENLTPWAAEQLFIILNQRYNNKAMTIFTSNLSLKKLNWWSSQFF